MNFGQTSLLCHRQHSNLVSKLFGKGPAIELDQIAIFPIAPQEKAQLELMAIPNMVIREYLDRFFLCISLADRNAREELFDAFFSLIADDYETLIDVRRNLGNIQNLLDFLDKLVGPIKDLTVLDYGCGTGLSLAPAKRLGINIVGYDSCEKMRQISAGRGMSVWNFADLSNSNGPLIEGAFSSYVLHLFPNPDELKLMLKKLKPGGAFVANFHKNQGMEPLNQLIVDWGWNVKRLTAPKGSERHGAYFAYVNDR